MIILKRVILDERILLYVRKRNQIANLKEEIDKLEEAGEKILSNQSQTGNDLAQ